MIENPKRGMQVVANRHLVGDSRLFASRGERLVVVRHSPQRPLPVEVARIQGGAEPFCAAYEELDPVEDPS